MVETIEMLEMVENNKNLDKNLFHFIPIYPKFI